MIYLAKVVLTDGKTDIAKEIITSVPPEKAVIDNDVFVRATRKITDIKKTKLKVKSVTKIKPINGLQ